jgi:hypothetical protein
LSDCWYREALKDSYPQLFSFTKKPKWSIRFFIEQEVDRIFSLPLSVQAAEQLEEVEAILAERTWDEHTNDIWNYSWRPSKYSSNKAYLILNGNT